MRRPRFGLQARFAVIAAAVLLVTLALVALVVHRQNQLHGEVRTLGLQAIDEFSSRRLLSQGQTHVVQLADSLVNPLYYFDLDAIGVALRHVLRQPLACVVGALHTTLSNLSRTLFITMPGLGPDDYGLSLQGYLISLPNQLIVYALVLTITHNLDRYRRARNRELEAVQLRAALTQAQLEALRRQLEPHFLFTTLNSVSELIYSRPAAAEEMIARLSALLRHAFSPASDHETTLADELRLLDLYLDIMRLRFAERLFVQIDVPDALRAARVPRLLLQPLIDVAAADEVAADQEAPVIARAHHGSLAREERELEEARATAVAAARKRVEIERSRNDFRRNGYERQGGGFSNDKLIGDVLGGIIGGVLSSRALRDALSSGYRPRGGGRPSVGGGVRVLAVVGAWRPSRLNPRDQEDASSRFNGS